MCICVPVYLKMAKYSQQADKLKVRISAEKVRESAEKCESDPFSHTMSVLPLFFLKGTPHPAHQNNKEKDHFFPLLFAIFHSSTIVVNTMLQITPPNGVFAITPCCSLL